MKFQTDAVLREEPSEASLTSDPPRDGGRKQAAEHGQRDDGGPWQWPRLGLRVRVAATVSERRAPSARAQRRPWSFRPHRSCIAARRCFLSTTLARARAWRGQAARSGAQRREQRPGEAGRQYLVDGQDRRVGKNKNGVLERAWLYRNQLNPVAELDGSGALVARFVYGSKSNVPEYMVRGGVTYRVLSDHLGSPRALVDVVTGAVAWRADFDAWGNRTLIAGTADFLPFGFAGGMLDSETGLTRFGARDYDASVGRWASKDPITFRARSTNLYEYSFGDPVNWFDHTGLKPIPDKDCYEKCVADLWPELLKCIANNCGNVPPGPEREKCANENCGGVLKDIEAYCTEKCDIICSG